MIHVKVKVCWYIFFPLHTHIYKKGIFSLLSYHFRLSSNTLMICRWECTRILTPMMVVISSSFFALRILMEKLKQIRNGNQAKTAEWTVVVLFSFLELADFYMHAPYVWDENKHYHSIVLVVCVVVSSIPMRGCVFSISSTQSFACVNGCHSVTFHYVSW